MKKLNILLLTALTAVSGSALALGGSVEQGKNFTNLNLEMGKSSSGLYVESNWLKNTDDGTLLNAATQSQCRTRYSSQRSQQKDIQFFHLICLVINLIWAHLNKRC